MVVCVWSSIWFFLIVYLHHSHRQSFNENLTDHKLRHYLPLFYVWGQTLPFGDLASHMKHTQHFSELNLPPTKTYFIVYEKNWWSWTAVFKQLSDGVIWCVVSSVRQWFAKIHAYNLLNLIIFDRLVMVIGKHSSNVKEPRLFLHKCQGFGFTPSNSALRYGQNN